MAVTWTISLKLGSSPDSASIHELTVEATTPVEALSRCAEILSARQAADASAGVLIDGQEEVFARAEVEAGAIEHQANT